MMKKTTLIIVLTILNLSGLSAAGLDFCNRTDSKMYIAVAYRSNSQWVSKGWYVAQPGECVKAVAGNLKNRYYYYFAETDDSRYWKENYNFCVKTASFTIYGDKNCSSRGYRTQGFRKIDTGESYSYTTHLSAGSKGSDSYYKEMILGTWKQTVYEDGVSMKMESTYTSNGRWIASGEIKASGVSYNLIASGTWSIYNGYITETVSSSNISQFVPNGYTTTDKIIKMENNEFTYYSPSTGDRSTAYFVKN